MILKRLFGIAPLQIAQALLGFGAIAAFTRLMSPDEFGRYALALSVSMLAHTLIFTWAEAAAYRFFAAAKAEGRLRPHFATLMALCVALGAGVMVLTAALLIVTDLRADIAALTAFAAGSAVFRFLTRVVRETERAAFEVQRYAAAESLYLVIGFAAGIAFLTVFDLGPAAPFAGLMLAGAIMMLLDAPKLFACAQGGDISIDRAGQYAVYGAPLAIALAVDLGVQTLARFILAHDSGAASLGAYAAAFGLARPLDIIFLWAGAALMPALLAAYEDHGHEAARTEAKRIFTLIASIAIPAAIGLALVAEPLAALLIGEGLSANAGRALPWLAFATLVSGFNLYYWSEAFQLTRRTSLRAIIMLAPGAAQIALTLWLAKPYGAQGAAMAAASASLIGTFALALVGRRLISLPIPLATLARIGAACTAMTAAILALPHLGDLADLALRASVGAGIYALAISFLEPSIRARAAALSQTLGFRVRAIVHPSFTDSANVRVP